MREVECSEISEVVAYLCAQANIYLPPDVLKCLENARETEESPSGRGVFDQILKNVEIAGKEKIALCQDCGTAIIFLELGQEAHIIGGDLYSAINEGVRQGYKKAYLRNSMCDPFTRKNTGDNTPAEIHTEIVSGDTVKITILPKGGGAENMSALKMLKPSQGRGGIEEFVIETVKNAGANPCPPIVVGVGIGGGSLNEAALLAKRALLYPLASVSAHSYDVMELERELLEEINKLGIGPAGYGGRNTALAVLINVAPCHIASLPVAVNLNCHCARRRTAVVGGHAKCPR